MVSGLSAQGLAPNATTRQLILYLHSAARDWDGALAAVDALATAPGSSSGATAGSSAAGDDAWHVVCRELDNAGAPAAAVRAVLRRMDAATRHRFDAMYALTSRDAFGRGSSGGAQDGSHEGGEGGVVGEHGDGGATLADEIGEGWQGKRGARAARRLRRAQQRAAAEGGAADDGKPERNEWEEESA